MRGFAPADRGSPWCVLHTDDVGQCPATVFLGWGIQMLWEWPSPVAEGDRRKGDVGLAELSSVSEPRSILGKRWAARWSLQCCGRRARQMVDGRTGTGNCQVSLGPLPKWRQVMPLM